MNLFLTDTVITSEASSGMFQTTLLFGGMLLFHLLRIAVIAYLLFLLIKALREYLKSNEARKENAVVLKSLGKVLKDHRIRCQMTQEFVAEHLGVSRQAVSKWENGTSDPSTSNLLALAKLYGVDAADLLRQVNPEA